MYVKSRPGRGCFRACRTSVDYYNIKQVGITLTHTAVKLPSGCLLNSQKMTYQTRIPLWLTYGCAAGVDVPVSPSVARGQDLCIQESMDCSNSNLVR